MTRSAFKRTPVADLKIIVRHAERWRQARDAARPTVSQLMNRAHHDRLMLLADEWEAQASEQTLAGRPRRAWYLEQLAADLRSSAEQRVVTTARKIQEQAA